MDTTEYFRAAVYYILKEKGLTQLKTAHAIKEDPQSLNAFLRGRRGFSEKKKENLAEFLGTTYLDMLKLGESLVQNGEAPEVPRVIIGHQSVSSSMGQDDGNVVIELNGPPHKKHHQLINRFQDKDRAYEANQALLNIEENDPEMFREVVAYLKGRGDSLIKKKPPVKKRANGED